MRNANDRACDCKRKTGEAQFMGHLMASPFVRACTPLAKSEEKRDWQVM